MEVRNFVARHRCEFREVHLEGCPVRWTQLHRDYRQIFERKLRAVVQAERKT